MTATAIFGVSCHTPSVIKNLNCPCGVARFDLLVSQSVRRAIIMPFDLDVIIHIDPCLLPAGEFIRTIRQGLEARLLKLEEDGLPAPIKFFEPALIELKQKLFD